MKNEYDTNIYQYPINRSSTDIFSIIADDIFEYKK